MQKIFISYSRDDADFALRLAGDLRAQGVPVWLDHLDITVGSRWDHEVEVALRACATLVVLLSPASVSSHNVMDEVSYALEEGKRVIPVMIRDCEIPFRLRRLQRVNFMTSYESGLGGLLPILGTASPESPAEAARTGDDVSASLAPSEAMIPDTAPAGSQVELPTTTGRRQIKMAAAAIVAVFAAGLIGLNATKNGQPSHTLAPASAPGPAAALTPATVANQTAAASHCGGEGQPICMFSPALRTGRTGCDGAGFVDPLSGRECWTCPSGWSRSTHPVSSAQACIAPIGAACQPDLVANRGSCVRPQACGGDGERPCTLIERIPSCNTGLVENFLTNRCQRRAAQ
jgi:hypothetical protein